MNMKKKGWIVKSISKEGKIGIVERVEKDFEGKPETKIVSWDEIKPKRIAEKQKLRINDKLVEKKGFYYVKSKKYLIMLILILSTISIAFGGYFLLNQEEEKPFNRYVEDITENTNTNTDSAQTRVRFNTTITVKKNTLQNINLENVNKGKNMQLKINYKNDIVFDSGLVEYGKILKSDVLKKEMPKGEHKVTAEIYSFDLEGNKTNQTNVNIKLIVK